jgi:hypothetical protein
MEKSDRTLFLKNREEKMGGPETLAVLAMLAMLLLDRTQPQ